jgi:hypothetical protein
MPSIATQDKIKHCLNIYKPICDNCFLKKKKHTTINANGDIICSTSHITFATLRYFTLPEIHKAHEMSDMSRVHQA